MFEDRELTDLKQGARRQKPPVSRLFLQIGQPTDADGGEKAEIRKS